jgi:peroxiredoxin Q/BCP
MPELQEGSKAPAIKLPTDTGATFDLKELRGKKVVLFFFPKANTSG